MSSSLRLLQVDEMGDVQPYADAPIAPVPKKHWRDVGDELKRNIKSEGGPHGALGLPGELLKRHQASSKSKIRSDGRYHPFHV